MDKKNIIIVEDERIIAQDIKDTLTSYGYNILNIFSKGEDLLENFDRLSPDLILMDIMLAGELNGIETAEKIHRKSSVPIIYLTAYANEDVLSKAKITEPYGYLIKPFEDRELYATIEMAFHRHKMQEEINTTQTRLSVIFQNVPNILLYEFGNNRRFISENVTLFLGEYSEIIEDRNSLLNFIHEDDKQLITQKIENWNRSERKSLLKLWYRIRNAQGNYIWVEDSSQELIDSNGNSYITGVIIDIDDIKNAEAELKKITSRYRAIVEDQTEFICRFDAHKIITFVNLAFCRLKKQSDKELIGNSWNKQFPENEIEKINHILDSLSCAKPVAGYEFWYHDGETDLYLEWTFRAIYNESNDFLEFQVVGRDATLRKQAEIEKEKIREQLYQSQKMEVIGKLAGGIAHDFNNLLTAINGYADSAMKKLNRDHPVFNEIEIIKDCGLRAAALTKQLLGFSRKQIMEKKVIDLNDIIRNLNKMLLRLLGDDISLRLECAENEKCLVYADTSQIEQVLVNLIVNARDAMPGGGTIIVKTENCFVDENTAEKLQLNQAGEYKVLSVQDSGTGIPAEILDKIFEPFFTTKEVGKGTGLGLATVYGIVKQNNGHISVESELNKGTIFRILLPASKMTETSEPEPTEKTEPAGGTETILVVEDEEAIRDFVASILSEVGYNVLEAANGQEALQLANNYADEIHLLLSDIRMAKMSGFELAEKIKVKFPEIKIVFVSGYTENEEMRVLIEHSRAVFLHKPFSYDDLIQKVRNVLDT